MAGAHRHGTGSHFNNATSFIFFACMSSIYDIVNPPPKVFRSVRIRKCLFAFGLKNRSQHFCCGLPSPNTQKRPSSLHFISTVSQKHTAGVCNARCLFDGEKGDYIFILLPFFFISYSHQNRLRLHSFFSFFFFVEFIQSFASDLDFLDGRKHKLDLYADWMD